MPNKEVSVQANEAMPFAEPRNSIRCLPFELDSRCFVTKWTRPSARKGVLANHDKIRLKSVRCFEGNMIPISTPQQLDDELKELAANNWEGLTRSDFNAKTIFCAFTCSGKNNTPNKRVSRRQRQRAKKNVANEASSSGVIKHMKQNPKGGNKPYFGKMSGSGSKPYFGKRGGSDSQAVPPMLEGPKLPCHQQLTQTNVTMDLPLDHINLSRCAQFATSMTIQVPLDSVDDEETSCLDWLPCRLTEQFTVEGWQEKVVEPWVEELLVGKKLLYVGGYAIASKTHLRESIRAHSSVDNMNLRFFIADSSDIPQSDTITIHVPANSLGLARSSLHIFPCHLDENLRVTLWRAGAVDSSMEQKLLGARLLSVDGQDVTSEPDLEQAIRKLKSLWSSDWGNTSNYPIKLQFRVDDTSFQPPASPMSSNSQRDSIRVRGVPTTITSDELRDYFEFYGEVGKITAVEENPPQVQIDFIELYDEDVYTDSHQALAPFIEIVEGKVPKARRDTTDNASTAIDFASGDEDVVMGEGSVVRRFG